MPIILTGAGTAGGGGGGGDASAANQSTQITAANLTNTDLGGVTETAPATDTASSGLNGRLQRIAQRLTSLIALLPTSLGQKTMANSMAMVLASDQASVPVAATLTASELHIGQVGGTITNPTANFTRPADTTAYAIGDLVANSTTAGSVTAMSPTITRIATGSAMLRRIKLHKSGTSVTNAAFRAHLFRAQPSTITNGDNGAFSVSGVADYLGAADLILDQAFTDGASGYGLPVVGGDMAIKLASGSVVYVLLEARAAYTPASAEVFTISLDVLQD